MALRSSSLVRARLPEAGGPSYSGLGALNVCISGQTLSHYPMANLFDRRIPHTNRDNAYGDASLFKLRHLTYEVHF